MAKKHIVDYYNKLANMYLEMNEDIKEFEAQCSKEMVSSERLEQMKATIAPIKENYLRWSYVMYLLNLPQRDSKRKRYEKINAKQIAQLGEYFDKDAKESEETLKNLKF